MQHSSIQKLFVSLTARQKLTLAFAACGVLLIALTGLLMYSRIDEARSLRLHTPEIYTNKSAQVSAMFSVTNTGRKTTYNPRITIEVWTNGSFGRFFEEIPRDKSWLEPREVMKLHLLLPEAGYKWRASVRWDAAPDPLRKLGIRWDAMTQSHGQASPLSALYFIESNSHTNYSPEFTR